MISSTAFPPSWTRLRNLAAALNGMAAMLEAASRPWKRRTRQQGAVTYPGRPFVALLARHMHRPRADMTTAETVRRVLMDAAGNALCDSCLAFACSVTLDEMRQVTEELLTSRSFHGRDRCICCHHTVPATAYSVKCVHCSHAVLPRGGAIASGGDIFHAACFKILVSDKSIRMSRKLTRESRRLIEDARREMHEQRRPSSD